DPSPLNQLRICALRAPSSPPPPLARQPKSDLWPHHELFLPRATLEAARFYPSPCHRQALLRRYFSTSSTASPRRGVDIHAAQHAQYPGCPPASEQASPFRRASSNATASQYTQCVLEPWLPKPAHAAPPWWPLQNRRRLLPTRY